MCMYLVCNWSVIVLIYHNLYGTNNVHMLDRNILDRNILDGNIWTKYYY